MTDRVIVRRADDQSLSDLAAALIALADDPHQVVWEHRAGYLTVPEYVAARYAGTMDAIEDETAEVEESAPAVAETAEVVVEMPVKRKPGRPRKAVAAVIEEEVN